MNNALQTGERNNPVRASFHSRRRGAPAAKAVHLAQQDRCRHKRSELPRMLGTHLPYGPARWRRGPFLTIRKPRRSSLERRYRGTSGPQLIQNSSDALRSELRPNRHGSALLNLTEYAGVFQTRPKPWRLSMWLAAALPPESFRAIHRNATSGSTSEAAGRTILPSGVRYQSGPSWISHSPGHRRTQQREAERHPASHRSRWPP